MNETDYISIHTGGDLEVDVLKPAQSKIFASLSRFSLAVTPSPKSRYSQGYSLLSLGSPLPSPPSQGTIKDIRLPL